MEFSDNLFVYEVISEEDATVRLKRGIGIFGKEVEYFNSKASVPFNGDVLEIPETVYFGGVHYKVVAVEKDVFHNLSSLATLFIPCYIENFCWGFYECSNLQNIKVSSQNSNYKDIDGVLYSKDGDNLVAFPVGRKGHYDIPKGVKQILSFAFKTASISSLTIPDTVIKICNNVFYRCKHLSEIELPSTLQFIGKYDNNTTTKFRFRQKLYSAEEIYNQVNL